VFGLTGLMPDYAMVIVGANMGVPRMTREHLVQFYLVTIEFTEQH
jgi:GTPase